MVEATTNTTVAMVSQTEAVMTAIVTGSAGLVGEAVVRLLIKEGMSVIGADNNMRGQLFGKEASVTESINSLIKDYPISYTHCSMDLRSSRAIEHLMTVPDDIDLIVHTAGQPSHDWSAHSPVVDFDLNAVVTVKLLEATRVLFPKATFVLLSTNKVYGTRPNRLLLREYDKRLDLMPAHELYNGINEGIRVDHTLHSPFGVSKLAADLMTQEYGRYFDMKTTVFRCGCLTGGKHRGVKLHGFLAYLMKCVATDTPYTVIGYGGKQVRDNLHTDDVARAVLAAYNYPSYGDVYNLGGGRANSCSVLEALDLAEQFTGHKPIFSHNPTARKGDHRWWISDYGRFSKRTGWYPQVTLAKIMEDLS